MSPLFSWALVNSSTLQSCVLNYIEFKYTFIMVLIGQPSNKGISITTCETALRLAPYASIRISDNENFNGNFRTH